MHLLLCYSFNAWFFFVIHLIYWYQWTIIILFNLNVKVLSALSMTQLYGREPLLFNMFWNFASKGLPMHWKQSVFHFSNWQKHVVLCWENNEWNPFYLIFSSIWSLIIFCGETMRTITFPYIICILLLLCRINIYFIQSHSANCNYSVHQPKKMSRDGEQGFGMWMWWECLFPTNVSQIRFPDPVYYVGEVWCWFSTLLREVFLQVLTGFPLFSWSKTKISKFKFDLAMHGDFWTSSCELLGAPWVSKLHLIIYVTDEQQPLSLHLWAKKHVDISLNRVLTIAPLRIIACVNDDNYCKPRSGPGHNQDQPLLTLLLVFNQ